MNDPRWALAQRIIASPHLSSSPKLCDFFLYVVDCCLRNAPEEATEQQIGVHVFHRIPGYNSSDDSIVRSQARLLRMKLTAYFSNEGSHEELIVEIPKGHYLPVFRPSAQTFPALEIVQPAEPAFITPVDPVNERALASPLLNKEQSKKNSRWTNLAVALVCLLLGGLAGLLLGHHFFSVSSSRTEVDVFWKPFLDGEPPLIIYSNPLFRGTPFTGLKLVPNADTPDSAEYTGTPDETYTGTGEVAAIHELTKIFDSQQKDFTLKRSRLVTWDEAKLRNLIFVGAPSQNGALQDLPTISDFAISLDAGNKGYIVNRHPLQGEPQSFVPSSPNDEYAILASIPGIQANRRIAIFTGLTTNGTQAAVEFACNPDNVQQLANRIGLSNGVLKPFEAVLHVKLSGGVPIQSDLVAIHPH
ncbi:hypothetical protein [Edaphobacter albus]|uniref:hypothetical protein n=1 Tax=Edaphobacter sp. 4G125 TaxID=2763071 RepID=UPI0016490421|nr:hypothetical protein [Edaphobacter sp. 4G125]QNI36477.1 hypothetical protein H7846_16180 [Edaphobacter sp. 4G125]